MFSAKRLTRIGKAAVIHSSFLSVGLALHADSISNWEVLDEWAVRADWSLGGGCFIFKEYTSSRVFRIGLSPREDNSYMVIVDTNWASLEAEKLYDLEVELGNNPLRPIQAIGYQFPDSSIIGLWTSFKDPDFMFELAQQSDIKFYYNQKPIADLSLDGISSAFQSMAECQTAVNTGSLTNPNDPFAQPNKPSDN